MKTLFCLKNMIYFFVLPLYGSEGLSNCTSIFVQKSYLSIISFDKNVSTKYFKLVIADRYVLLKKNPAYLNNVYRCLNMQNNNVLHFDQKNIESYIATIKKTDEQEYLRNNKICIFSCKTLYYISEICSKGFPFDIHEKDKHIHLYECLVHAYYLADFLLYHRILNEDIFPYDTMHSIASKLFPKCLSVDHQAKAVLEQVINEKSGIVFEKSSYQTTFLLNN